MYLYESVLDLLIEELPLADAGDAMQHPNQGPSYTPNGHRVYPGLGGIYCLHFGKWGMYIGRTNNFNFRWIKHHEDLSVGQHKNYKLQRAYMLNEWSYVTSVLLYTEDYLRQLWAEKYYIERYGTLNIVSSAH